jgi:hypothetical protein
MYWVPNPAQATWGSGAPPPSDTWIKDFLTFYDFGPPDDVDSSDGKQCVFNSAPSTIDEVIGVLVDQASLAGYQANRGKARNIAKTIYDQRRAAKQKGADVLKKGATDLSSLSGLDMPSLLDALEVVRKSGKLDDLAKQTTSPKMLAAILSVQHHLGDRWAGYMRSLSDDDQSAIRQHIYTQMLKGDVGDTKPLSGAKGPFISPPVSDEDWVKGFLNWFDLSVDPLSSEKFLFNGKTTDPFDVVDTVLEQGALAGYLLKRDDVRKLAATVVRSRSGGQKNVGWQFQVSGGLQYAGHWILRDARKGKKLTPNDPATDWTMQAQIAAVYAGHPEDASGPEIAGLVQLGYNATTGQVTALGGLQGALVQSLWLGPNGKGIKAQIQESLQAIGGTLTETKINSTKGQFQSQIGVQFLVKLGPVWVGLQASGGITLTANTPMNFPGALTLVIQW